MSDNTQDSTPDNTFPSKLLKKLPSGFTDTVESMSVDEIKKVIFESEGNIYTIEKAKDSDIKLNGARDFVKECSAPYTEAKTAQSAKIKYCLYLLESRGVNLESKES